MKFVLMFLLVAGLVGLEAGLEVRHMEPSRWDLSEGWLRFGPGFGCRGLCGSG